MPSGSAKATGGTIVTNGTHWIHIFTSSGTFAPTESLTVDWLVVAGGGAGAAGGGGAGGLRSTLDNTGGLGTLESTKSVTATSYTVTVGAGAAGSLDPRNISGSAGSNSVFDDKTSTGGGGGGAYTTGTLTGGSGGSGGGGGGGADSTSRAGGSRTASPVQGFDGGASANVTNGRRGGGGGAGAAGSSGTNGTSNAGTRGDGGDGVQVSITGVSTYYAGGGGGSSGSGDFAPNDGRGGLGGGGDGQTGNVNFMRLDGQPNTGGGGGAMEGLTTPNNTGGNGGSGIVIIRYAI
jgi:hypothetical protein